MEPEFPYGRKIRGRRRFLLLKIRSKITNYKYIGSKDINKIRSSLYLVEIDERPLIKSKTGSQSKTDPNSRSESYSLPP